MIENENETTENTEDIEDAVQQPSELEQFVTTYLDGALDGKRLARKISPPTFISGAYGIAAGRPTAIVAYGGSGKTWLAIDLILATVTGLPNCWGVRDLVSLMDPARALHLDYEMGPRVISKRYQRVAEARGIDLTTLQNRLKVLPFPSLKLTTIFRTWEAEKIFHEMLKGFSLCVIDSFRASAPDVDENSSEARAPLDMLTRVSDRTKCAIVVLFHEAKPPMDNGRAKQFAMRGSSALYDACGTVLSVFPDEESQTIEIEHTKTSLGPKAPKISIRLEDRGDMDMEWFQHSGLEIASVNKKKEDETRKEANNKDREEKELKLLENLIGQAVKIVDKSEPRGIGHTDLRGAMKGASKDARDKAIKVAVSRGLIVRPEKGNHRPYRPWSAVKKDDASSTTNDVESTDNDSNEDKNEDEDGDEK